MIGTVVPYSTSPAAHQRVFEQARSADALADTDCLKPCSAVGWACKDLIIEAVKTRLANGTIIEIDRKGGGWGC